MDRQELLDILDEHGGQADLVIEADAMVKEFISQVRCPECSSLAVPIVNPRQPFSSGKLAPNFLGQCTSCGCEFDPYTRVIAKAGTLRTYGNPRDSQLT